GTVVNQETIGGTGPATLIGVSGPEGWIVDQYARTAPYPVAFSYITALTRLIGGSNSDFAEFRDQGISGIELAYLHGSSIYHTPADTPDRVNPGTLHQEGANTLAFVRNLANLERGGERDPGETVFFTLGRFLVVRYPVEGALILALLAGLALAVAGWRRRKAGAGSIRWGLAHTGIVVILSPLLAAVAWTVLATERSTMGVGESYLYLVLGLAMTVGIAIVVGRLLRRRDEPDPVAVVAIWWVLALLTAATAPGFSYLFGWPALAGGLVLLWRSWARGRARPWEELAGFALVVGVTLVLLVPAIDTFYQLVQPRPGNPDSQMLAIVVVPVVLIALVVELGRAFWARDAIRGDAGSPVPSR
ncbi:MAG: M28 family peptidase, partial [Chloroflexi bacterium]|nr:M28 family peptidase [Chloroflexota bacterium]